MEQTKNMKKHEEKKTKKRASKRTSKIERNAQQRWNDGDAVHHDTVSTPQQGSNEKEKSRDKADQIGQSRFKTQYGRIPIASPNPALTPAKHVDP